MADRSGTRGKLEEIDTIEVYWKFITINWFIGNAEGAAKWEPVVGEWSAKQRTMMRYGRQVHNVLWQLLPGRY